MDEDREQPESTESDDFRKLCPHYSRGCSFVSPCCGKVYPCRLCHDDQELTHKIDRYQVSVVECRSCHKRQPVAETCTECGITFGRYFCPTCRLYADEEKGQFHCEKCGLCRVGGRENFFHCDTCGYCLGLGVKESHFCRRQASRDNCPVCMEDLHTSRSAMHVTDCGHLLHAECYRQMLSKGLYQCPQCQRSITDMSSAWRRHDEERETWLMPLHLRNFKVKVKCRDCQQETETLFHVIGLKCTNPDCGSYNTVRSGNEEVPEDEGGGGEGGGMQLMFQNLVRMGRVVVQMLQEGREREEEEGEGEEEDDEDLLDENLLGAEGGEEEDLSMNESEAELLLADDNIAGQLHGDHHDNQTGYEADGSATDDEPATSASASAPVPNPGTEPGQASPNSEPTSDGACNTTASTLSSPPTITWYEEEEDEEEEDNEGLMEDWSTMAPTFASTSDFSDSFPRSDSHSSVSDSSWETEEEEVIIGGVPDNNEPEENWEDELGDSVAMATTTTNIPQQTLRVARPPQNADAYDAHIRLDQNGATQTGQTPTSPSPDLSTNTTP